jgi:hypothetical protein
MVGQACVDAMTSKRNDTPHSDTRHNATLSFNNHSLSHPAKGTSVVMQTVTIACGYAERRYTDCHYAECHYADCRYAECHYEECRGAACVSML